MMIGAKDGHHTLKLITTQDEHVIPIVILENQWSLKEILDTSEIL